MTTTFELLHYKPLDMVTAPYIDKRRPFLVLSRPHATTLLKQATACLVMSRDLHKPETLPTAPGWTVVPKNIAGLEKESLVTPTLCTHRLGAVSERIGELPHVFADSVLDDVRASMSLVTGSHALPAGFLKALPPPGIRHRNLPHFQILYRTLSASGWRSPRQGDILRAPPDFRKRWDYAWIVVSHTEFNRRYLYPQITVVPLMPVSATGYSAAQLRHDKRVVLGAEVGLEEDRVAIEEEVSTYDVAQSLFKPCRCCYQPKKRRRWRFLLPVGPHAGKCIQCDGAPALWPMNLGTIAAPPRRHDLERIMKNLSAYLCA